MSWRASWIVWRTRGPFRRLRCSGFHPFYLASPWVHRNGFCFRIYMWLAHWVWSWDPPVGTRRRRLWVRGAMKLLNNRFIHWQG